MKLFIYNYFLAILRKKILNCILPYRMLVLAYSGGLDSMVLLDVLIDLLHYFKIKNNKFFFKLRVIYLNHNLYKYSDFCINYCSYKCKKYKISFDIISILVNILYNKNIESSARYIRYKTLIEQLKYGEVLLTGHHQTDQIETIFLFLKRGSGLNGLSGIVKKKILYNSFKLLRPLLNFSKKKLFIYAKKYKFRWIEDFSNLFLRFDRNFIRFKILPVFQNRWNFINKTISKSSKFCYKQNLLLNKFLNNILITYLFPDGSLEFDKLKKINKIKFNNILYNWFGINNIKVSNKFLSYLFNILMNVKNKYNFFLIFNKFKINFYNNRLYIFFFKKNNNNYSIKLEWLLFNFNSSILFPFNLGILFKKQKNFSLFYNYYLKNSFCFSNSNYFKNLFNFNYLNYLSLSFVRSPYFNERVFIYFGYKYGFFYNLNKFHGLTFKKCIINFNILSWNKFLIPLLFYNEIFISAIGFFVSNEGRIIDKYSFNNFFFWSFLYI